jgi:hypothetical protein
MYLIKFYVHIVYYKKKSCKYNIILIYYMRSTKNVQKYYDEKTNFSISIK